MKKKVERWRTRLYNREQGWVDVHTRFAAFIRRRLSPDMRILNLGAGAGWDGPVNFENDVSHMVGLDPDWAITTNAHLDERIVGCGEDLPFSDGSLDLVYSDWVVEHLAAPQTVVLEVFRVLKPGGCFIFRTGNLYHYVYAVGALTPHWFHRLVADRARGAPAEPDGVFETFYRMNRPGLVRRRLAEAGFVEDELAMVEPEPAYLMFAVPALLLGAAYERMLNRFLLLSGLRANIVACFRKPDSPYLSDKTISCLVNRG